MSPIFLRQIKNKRHELAWWEVSCVRDMTPSLVSLSRDLSQRINHQFSTHHCPRHQFTVSTAQLKNDMIDNIKARWKLVACRCHCSCIICLLITIQLKVGLLEVLLLRNRSCNRDLRLQVTLSYLKLRILDQSYLLYLKMQSELKFYWVVLYQ